jgi:hypothetical protein
LTHDFGIIDENADGFELTVSDSADGECRLVAVVQTERGPRRTVIAAVPAGVWRAVASAATKELVSEMGSEERDKKVPTLKGGTNRMGSLIGRELGVLLMVLMEEDAVARIDTLLGAWRELAREERWWLYGKAAAPSQRIGAGWRRALFHALGESSDTRSTPVEVAEKKSVARTGKAASPKRKLNTSRKPKKPTQVK